MKKETGCINAEVIIEYVKEYDKGSLSALLTNLDPEIGSLPNPESCLQDPNNWISCTIIVKLLSRAKLILKDDLAAYKIARYAVEKTSLGYTQGIIIKAFWSTKKGLKNLQRINDKWNRSKRIELVEIKRNEAIIRLHWDPGMDLSKDMCLFNQGSYTFMPLVWGSKPLELKENCCFFEDASYCEYHLRWPFRNRFYEIYSRFFTSKSVLMETIREMEEDKKIIEEKYEEVNLLNLELNHKIKQLMAIQETGKAILSVLDLDQLLTVIMNILSNVCKINRAMIMLVNDEESCLEYLYSLGFDGEVPEPVKDYTVPLSRVSNILARVASTGRPEYVPEVVSSSLSKENIILTHGKPRSVFVAPLITRSKVIGIIATDATEGEEVPEETRETMGIFTPQIAIAIENARLYSRLQEQMTELKRSHALLSRAEKFSFLGNLSARLAHEIKNPMTAIGTFLQMLPQKYDDEEFREEFHKIALEETTRVNNLITELLDLVKKKETHFEFNDIHDLIDKMILLVSPQTNAKKIEVMRRFSPDIGQVWLDPERMKEVVLNLLSNALEFTTQGGKIEIVTRIGKQKLKPRNICIEIRDNGAGIPESMIEKIFDPYFTTKHKSNIHNGTGLGLFIAHKNMLDHGGSIEVKSKVNVGTTFFLTLPVHPPSKYSGYKERGFHAD
ncbi:MAG: GAF domain-containing protein, partial [Deltaproteobacteria bacterium]|nr:GAF domain-containing protein [Deltaproteobacteria bacterium]